MTDVLLALCVLTMRFPDPATAVAIVLAESGGSPHAIGVDYGSIDRGLWQFNSRWHADITDAEAYDPLHSTEAAYALSKGGTDFRPWAAYTRGAYRKNLNRARVAVAQAGDLIAYWKVQCEP